MNDETRATLRLLIDHELDRIKDAHREGALGWDDPIIVPKQLIGDEAMSSIIAVDDALRGLRYPPEQTTLRRWRAQVVKLRELL